MAAANHKVRALHSIGNSDHLIRVSHIHPGQIRVALYHGSNRRGRLSGLFNHDIVLTNYDTLRSEWTGRAREGLLYSKEWARIVLDEGESHSLIGPWWFL
jgi:SNF2 family DNA or RNA helicase